MIRLKGEARKILKEIYSRGYRHTLEHKRGAIKITLFDGPVYVAESAGFHPLSVVKKLQEEVEEYEEVSECLTRSMRFGEVWWLREELPEAQA